MPTRLRVRVTPRAGRDEIVGWRSGELQICVATPPEDGRANAAVCKLVAKTLGVPKSSVSVTRGGSARHKTLEIEGIEGSAVSAILGDPDEPSRP